MTAILIDDEPLARLHLRRMVEAQLVEVVGEGTTGIEALNLSETLKPDIAFLDIQVPDLSGLQAAAALMHLDPAPLLVFVTGFTEHAVEAFEYAAFDYLLKPVDPARLAVTLTRANKTLSRANSGAKQEIQQQHLSPAKRLPVRTDYAIKLIRFDEVEFALARDKKVFVRVGGVDQKTYYSLVQLERLLPTEEFVRIHASAIVRLERIEELNFLGNHTYSATLSGGAVLPVGRSYYTELQRRLGID